MKKLILLTVLVFSLTALMANMPGMGMNSTISELSDNLYDNSSYSFSTGIYSTMNRHFSYSLLSAQYSKAINRNWALNYDVSHFNRNFTDNYVFTGVGLTYHKENFNFSIYFNKGFDANQINEFKLNNY